MLVSPKIPRKLRRASQTYSALIFRPEAVLDVRMFETREHHRSVPGDGYPWIPAPSGTAWGGPWMNAWFRGEFAVPQRLAGRPLFLRAKADAIEALLWVNDRPAGLFTHPGEGAQIGNHHTQLISPGSGEEENIRIAVEAYGGHPCVGSQPFDDPTTQTRYPIRHPRHFHSLEIMTRDDEVRDFVFDLMTLTQLFEVLPENSFRRGKLARVLERVFRIIPQDPGATSEWREPLREARRVMAAALAVPAGPSAPVAGLVGHSHLDTAWMWTLEETARKAARTYSGALSLMEQYPEFTFVQSSPCHADLMRRNYPSIWEGIVRRVTEGRWEPNGGMWIECDCNLTGGESLVRQFLKGIAFTREHFSYTPDTFWLPDSFGFSAAIPQIMLGCGLRYFLTTKLTWNEVNTFPYDTFLWQGLDGSRVLSHFNDIQCWPDPATLVAKLEGGAKDFRSVENYIQHKDVNDRRLISYGMGDGGGGPQFEMLEMARRCADLDGCPRARHTTVSRFMRELEATSDSPPVYSGELYVEGHRGSLTSMQRIKRGNRMAESALRDAEILMVSQGRCGEGELRRRLEACWQTLLVNQFHDILPGTSIPEVHDRAIAELEQVVEEARRISAELIGKPDETGCAIWNTLGWDRSSIAALPGIPENLAPEGFSIWQRIRDIEDRPILLLPIDHVPALGARAIRFTHRPAPVASSSPFSYDGRRLDMPFGSIVFDSDGRIISLRTRPNDREICRPGGFLNLFLLGEDVPEAWDNWDIDEDQALKMRDQARLIRRQVVADGSLQFRLRSEWRLGERSAIVQDLVLFADSPRIVFETALDWRERHALLKTSFQTAVLPSAARHEIQFGHIERPAHRNNRFETVKFEVCNHRWTDLSESRHGVALLNDSKYGVSVNGGEMRLSLAKSGLHPDPRGDAGRHLFTYALLPHEEGFSTEAVVRPACELNAGLCVGEAVERASLLRISESNVLCEAVKPAEDGRGFIVRLYEAERSSGTVRVSFRSRPAAVFRTNLLEEDIEQLSVENESVVLPLGAFQIATIRILPENRSVPA